METCGTWERIWKKTDGALGQRKGFLLKECNRAADGHPVPTADSVMPRLAPAALKSALIWQGAPITICSDMASQTLTGSWVIYRALLPLQFLWGSKWLISMVVRSGLDTFFVSPDLLSREKLGHKTYMRLKRVGPSCQYPSFNSQYCPVVTHTIWANPLAAVRKSDIEYQMTDASKPPTYKTCKQSFRGTAELPYFRAPRQEAWCGPHRI